MKNFKRLIAILLALFALPMCLFACEEGGQTDGTVDPNDTTDGLLVSITVRNLPEAEGELGSPFVKTKEGDRVKPGTTLLDAVKALCEERGATYELDTLGRFSSFTFDGSTILSETEEQKDGTFIPIDFKVTVNGTEIAYGDYATLALNHNDVVEICLVKGEAFKAE